MVDSLHEIPEINKTRRHAAATYGVAVRSSRWLRQIKIHASVSTSHQRAFVRSRHLSNGTWFQKPSKRDSSLPLGDDGAICVKADYAGRQTRCALQGLDDNPFSIDILRELLRTGL
jgi:hypothetical protein